MYKRQALNNGSVIAIAYNTAESSSASMNRVFSGNGSFSDYTNGFAPFSGINALTGITETSIAAFSGDEYAQGSLAYMAVELLATGKILKSPRFFRWKSLSVADDVVFRGDARSPDVIFGEGGFMSKGDNFKLADHASGLFDDSAYIATSKSFDVAKARVQALGGGYVYTINKSKAGKGIDVNSKLGNKSPYPTELEIAYPLEISSEAITKVQRVLANQ